MAKKQEHSSGLISALKFIELCGSEHCFIGANQITAYSESVAVGHPIEEDLNAIAHIKHLKNALIKAEANTKITQIELSKLQVDAGEFTVYVNAGSEYAHTSPDAMVGTVPTGLEQAIKTLLPIVGSTQDPHGCIFIRTNSVFATNRRVLAEFWHGQVMPDILVSKELARLIVKAKRPISGFGYSDNSVTFYFADGSWIMGRMAGQWAIEPYQFLAQEIGMVTDIPTDVRSGISAIKPFVQSGNVYFLGKSVASHKEHNGAKFNLQVELPKAIFNLKDFEWILANFGKVSCSDLETSWYFFGENLRCVIASIEE